jgi:hypothetical protein
MTDFRDVRAFRDIRDGGGGGVLGVWWVLFVRVGDSFCSSYSVGGGGGGVSVIAREKAWVY